MFDIGFPELLIIGIVSLIVIGPEQLPATIRSIALWIGRFKKGFSDLRSEIERGIGADEIKQQLHNEAILKEIEKSKAAIAQTSRDAAAFAAEQTAALRQTTNVTQSQRAPDDRSE
ncbi:MAG: sec-independent protein translocase protein TatB [Candidatus Azotimanducaceae bacterium]|jgi:sec-independent protein translocase protein TatB|tara:strand:+ start:1251 stop:1598 length:348 start_codon:yes stop_codon:yes gene_type:complete